jgi:hypothetical protein
LVLLTAALGRDLPHPDLIEKFPTVTSGLQDGADRVAGAVRRGSDIAVQPVIAPAGVAAAVAEAVRAIRSIFRAE